MKKTVPYFDGCEVREVEVELQERPEKASKRRARSFVRKLPPVYMGPVTVVQDPEPVRREMQMDLIPAGRIYG